MHVRHHICVDCDRASKFKVTDDVLVALGHGPDFKLRPDTPEDTVHGSVSVAFCFTRTLGVDILMFQDGHTEVASADNIDAWWQEQGHRLERVVGNKAYGNTMVDVELYDNDELPTPEHGTTIRRAVNWPTAAEIRRRLDAGPP